MFSYEEVLEQINLKCQLNNGSAFEMEILSPIPWDRIYHAKKFLFSCSWEYEDSPVGSYKKCLEAEALLSKLPVGITYVKNTTITTPLPETIRLYQTAFERGTTTYTVIVSEEYSKKISQKINDNQVVISNVFDNNTLEEANTFKNNILKQHYDILEPLYTNGLLPFGCLDNFGFTDFDHGFGFPAIGMKPLSSEAQRLGLAMALSDYGRSYLTEGQYYYICRWNADTISISLKNRNTQKDNLKEW